MNVAQNAAHIHSKIKAACERANRNIDEVKLVAVTKYVSKETAQKALDAGMVHLGENRNEGFLDKYETLGEEAVWHFIGSLQTRKVRDVINKIDYLHSLDRLSLAKEIEKRAEHPLKCFIQVNVSNEETKHGLKKEEVIPFVQKLSDFQKIEVIGLMTMAPHIEDQVKLRHYFYELRLLKEKITALNLPSAPCTELSMGMSNDYEIAVEEGATFVRIGTSLVGKEF
ncbi:YggS family pyridoxal phosphate-dependent enzyme [Priestia endophytica]|uniref:YggS family pyridoxal phosphate-dependent enzyme n=1 Tax=Priestia endophytica TaxID=135735 RepID=UPI003D2DDB59